MKTYRYTRPLDGAAVDDTRELSADDAAALLASGAIVEVRAAVIAPDEADPSPSAAEPEALAASAPALSPPPAAAEPAPAPARRRQGRAN